jgi:hypothetical protein
MTHWSDGLARINACSDAIKWASTQPDLDTAWRECKRGDWMLWLIGKTNPSAPWSDERKPIVACCVEIAATTLKYCDDDTIMAAIWCIDAAERWTRGEAKQDEVEASYAASDSAYAAASSSAASSAAAYAAASSAYAATISSASAVSASAASAKSLSQAAKIVRKHFPNPPKIGDAK